jgi:hypothetical protein
MFWALCTIEVVNFGLEPTVEGSPASILRQVVSLGSGLILLIQRVCRAKEGGFVRYQNVALSTWNYFGDSFTYYSTRGGDLMSDVVTSVGESSSGILWVGTYGSGLSSINPLTGKVVHYRHNESQPGSLPDDQVMSLLVDRQDAAGGLWASNDVMAEGYLWAFAVDLETDGEPSQLAVTTSQCVQRRSR